MGRLLKVGALLLGLASLSLGDFLIALLCFGYLAVSALRGSKNTRATKSLQGQGPLSISRRAVLGLTLVALGGIAALSGGTFSPLVFGSLGLAVLLWRHLPVPRVLDSLSPVPESILLRSVYLPFRWCALAQMKFSESAPGSLSSLEGELLFDTRKAPAVYRPIRVTAATGREAESKAMTILAKEARAYAAQGVYLLPLDTDSAAEVLRLVPSGQDVRKLNFLSPRSDTPPTLSLEVEGGFVVRAASLEPGDAETRARLLPEGQRLDSRPLFLEVAQALQKKFSFVERDTYTSFLNSMHVTRGEPLRDRLTLGEQEGNSIEVEALGTPALRLSRPQLRAVTGMYG